MTVDLSGKVAVITGAGSGLGAAMGRVFAQAGAGVAVLDIDADAAQQVANSLAGDLGVPATWLRVDVGQADDLVAAADHVRDTLGGCDVLCANVGVQQTGAIDRLTDDDWRWVLDVNVFGTVRTVRAFLPLMRSATGWRRIVVTASSSVLAPAVRLGAYQTTKFALMGFGETLREELADEGIGVTVLFPGGHESPATSRAAPRPGLPTPPRPAVDQDEDLAAMLAHRPLGEGDVVMPEHAVRNLLAALEADEPYCITHGDHRPVYDQRQQAMADAFDRMERS